MTRGLLVDLDDTLYDYLPAHRAGLAAVLPRVGRALGTDVEGAERAWNTAREAVKRRLGATAASHSRLLYLAELTSAKGAVHALAEVRAWDRAYWEAFLAAAALRPGAVELLAGWRARGGKVAVVTDLMLEVQLWKLDRLGLVAHVDALAASEEVLRDKPAPEVFLLAMERLGATAADCVMIGDHPAKDGEGARALGIPFHHVRSSERPEAGGSTLAEVARLLEAAS